MLTYVQHQRQVANNGLTHGSKCRLKVFGAEHGRKEFENVLQGCDDAAARLHVYQEWLASSRAAREALSGKTSQRDLLKIKAYEDDEIRIAAAAARDFPDER